jgi:alkylation response protein AidB-like acyl-CoA dehydrogenase
VDFTLSPEQEALRDAARSMLAAECPTSLVRAHMDDPAAAGRLWAHLREWAGLAEAPLVDLCLFVEETGAVLAPGPFFATVAQAAPVLRSLGHPLVPAVLAGEATATLAVAGLDGRWVPNDDPVKTFVAEADRVDHVVVVRDGPRAAVAPAAAVTSRHVATLDPSRRLFEVDVPDGLDWSALGADAFADAMARATVAIAAEMLGTARWIFDTTLAYAKERVQFDRPIGSFQAVQHKLADMRLGLERAWSAVYYAAMTIDAGDTDRHRAAHAAKAAAGEAVRRNAKDGIQVHGGIGYTWEHDLHLFIRRAYGQEAWLGSADEHRDALAALIL